MRIKSQISMEETCCDCGKTKRTLQIIFCESKESEDGFFSGHVCMDCWNIRKKNMQHSKESTSGDERKRYEEIEIIIQDTLNDAFDRLPANPKVSDIIGLL